jgi:ABC-type sulfate transport system substrate-binding protein
MPNRQFWIWVTQKQKQRLTQELRMSNVTTKQRKQKTAIARILVAHVQLVEEVVQVSIIQNKKHLVLAHLVMVRLADVGYEVKNVKNRTRFRIWWS